MDHDARLVILELARLEVFKCPPNGIGTIVFPFGSLLERF